MASECNPISTRYEKLLPNAAEQLTPRRGNEKYTHMKGQPDMPYHKMCFIPVIKGAYPRNEEPRITCINFADESTTIAFYEALYETHKQSGDDQHAPNASKEKPIPKKFYDNDQFGIKPLVFIVLHQEAPKNTPDFFLAHFDTPEKAAAYTKLIWVVHENFLKTFHIKIKEPYEHGQPDISASSSEPSYSGSSLPPSAWLHSEIDPVHASSPAPLLPPTSSRPNTVYSSSSVHVSQPVSAAVAQLPLADSKDSSTFASAAPAYAPLLPPSAHASSPASHYSWASQAPVGLLDPPSPPITPAPTAAVVASKPYPETLLPLSFSQPPSASTHPSTAFSIPAPTATAVHASPAAFQSVSAAPEASNAGSNEEVIGYQMQISSKNHNWEIVLECWKKGSKEPLPLPGECNETDDWSNEDEEYCRRITSIPTIASRVIEDLGGGVVNIEQSWPFDLGIELDLPIDCIEALPLKRELDRMVRICTCVRAPSSSA
jgi:hypothetical protein